ncbi:MAG: lipid II:glycine glycyltransferase FemX [Candidatus Zhuqueibacterota bacterium]
MKFASKISKQYWEETIARCPNATFFHTCAWAKLMTAIYPHLSIATMGFEMSDGARAVLPLLSVRSRLKGMVRTFYTMVPGVYGGIVTDRRCLTRLELEMVFSKFKGLKFNHIVYVNNPYESYDIPGRYRESEMFTHILNLNQDYECIKRNFSRGNRSTINKAIRSGVTIELAQTYSDYQEYYEMYQDSLDRWGDRASSFYPFELFHHIFELNSPHIKLWLAKVDGIIIAGSLVFSYNNHVVAWHGAARRSHFEYRPNNLLYAQIIRDAYNQGYRYFDFNPSGGHEGVVHFKESFGAVRKYFNVQYWSSNPLYTFYLQRKKADQH